jgi:hypothetical protein
VVARERRRAALRRPSSRPRARRPNGRVSPPRRRSSTWRTSCASASRAVPYSLVAAIDQPTWQAIPCDGAGCGEAAPAYALPPIAINEWTARELGARVGDTLSLEYYLWHEEGRLETRRAEFRVHKIAPIAGAAADRELVPDYPGITKETRLADWDPPFAVDLSRVRPQDEAYWQQYRTTPKAWLPMPFGSGSGVIASARRHRSD